MKKISISIIAAFVAITAAVSTTFADGYPKSIRVGLVGNVYNKPFIGGAFGLIDEQQLLKKEFAKEGIDIQYVILKGTGPAINEAIANGAVDFASYGDLVGIVAKAGGLPVRILGLQGGTNETYVVGPANSPIKSFDELKGKKIGLLRGTYLHLSFNKIIHDKGLKESDFKIYNLQAADGLAAITSNAIDAYIGASNFLDLVDQGTGKLIYTTNIPGSPEKYKGFSEFVVTESFEKKYPDIVQRFVNVVVAATVKLQDEKNRADYLRLGAKNGTAYSVVSRDLGTKTLRWANNLSIDKDAIAKLKETVAEVKADGIIRKDIDVDKWVAPQYLTKAYQILGSDRPWLTNDKYIPASK